MVVFIPHGVYTGDAFLRRRTGRTVLWLSLGRRRMDLLHPCSAVSTARPEVAVSPNMEHRFAVGWGRIDLCDSASSRAYRG